MTNFEDHPWYVVRQMVANAKGMYWDGCHKIYLAMDSEEVVKMDEIGYEYFEPDFDTLKEWYSSSCFLKFVEAVFTNLEDANKGYISLIPQGFEEE